MEGETPPLHFGDSMHLDDKIKSAFSAAMSGHSKQVDKSGAPYIQHLMRVAGMVRAPEFIPVALLHDYFEDVYKTEDKSEMAKVFPYLNEVEIEALWLLTRPKTMTYLEYIRTLVSYRNKYAIEVKTSDLLDHLSSQHIDASLRERYNKALDLL